MAIFHIYVSLLEGSGDSSWVSLDLIGNFSTLGIIYGDISWARCNQLWSKVFFIVFPLIWIENWSDFMGIFSSKAWWVWIPIMRWPQAIHNGWTIAHLLISSSCMAIEGGAIQPAFRPSLFARYLLQLNIIHKCGPIGKILYQWSTFQQPMFDCRRVSIRLANKNSIHRNSGTKPRAPRYSWPLRKCGWVNGGSGERCNGYPFCPLLGELPETVWVSHPSGCAQWWLWITIGEMVEPSL